MRVYGDLSFLSGFYFGSIVVKDHDPETGHGLPHRSRTKFASQGGQVMIADHHAAFGLTIMVVYAHAEVHFAPGDNVRVQRFTRT